MTDIHRWLLGIGLNRYAEAFEHHNIDMEILEDLTDQDLEKLGVTLGHRKRILKAIQAMLPEKCDLGATARNAENRAAAKESPMEAERRQLTVVFCDLVDSTALSQLLDPEALRDLMHAYQKTCGHVVEKYEGHVAQYLGDGLMIYFGWPRAHEEDSERAIRASLEIVDVVKLINAPQPLQVRIGIGTGRVVVGETGGGDASVPKVAVGETPNLAARVQGLARPGEILVADRTRRLAQRVFDYEDRGRQTLKGIVEPVQIWHVLGLAQREGRFDALRDAKLSPFVGRDEELALILGRWSLACEGEGQVVTVQGEPGIGKSRILRELKLRLASAKHFMTQFQCSPYHTQSPLYPFIEQITREAHIAAGDAPDVGIAKLESSVAARGFAREEIVPLLGPVLSLPLGARYAVPDLSPQRLREETLLRLREWVLSSTVAQPGLVIFEDVHWIDPSSQQVLDLVVAAAQSRRVLILIMHRPEYRPAWAGYGHVVPLMLTRLARRQAARLAQTVAKENVLPEGVVQEIVTKADGVPLFVEELTKAVLESGRLKLVDGVYEVIGNPNDFTIPSTLHDSLMARLDRNASLREVAQVCACIGREFSRTSLAGVHPLNEAALDLALQELMDSELIYPIGAPSELRYMFKHALLRDAAYESLLRRRRCELHLAIARNLSASPGADPALLAEHYTKAEAPDLAVPKWLEAAHRSLAAAEHAESLAHIMSGLKLIDGIKSEDQRVNLEISLHTCRALNYVATRSYGAPEVQSSYAKAEELLPRVRDDAVALPVILGIGIFHWLRANFTESLGYFEELLQRARRVGDPLMEFAARAELGTIQLPLGRAAHGRQMLQDLLDDYDISKHGVLATLAGQDYAVLGAGLGAVGEAHLGYLDQARITAARGIEIAEQLRHPFSIGMALALATMTELERRDYTAAVELAARCVDISDKQGLPYWGNYGRVALGVGRARSGDLEAGISMIEAAILDMESLGSPQSTPWLRIYWAETMLLRGRRAEVRDAMYASLATIERTGQKWHEPMTYCMLGLAWAEGVDVDSAHAEAAFLRSIEHAREQQSKTSELRAATCLARQWYRDGQPDRGRELLAPIYAWFTEGVDTSVVMDARAVLENL